MVAEVNEADLKQIESELVRTKGTAARQRLLRMRYRILRALEKQEREVEEGVIGERATLKLTSKSAKLTIWKNYYPTSDREMLDEEMDS